jgi:putative SOS response-associated peptidase YedK
MCGRFALSAPVDIFRRHFDVPEAESLPPRFNIAPGQQVAAVRAGSDGNELAMLRWGLIPFWAKDVKIGYRLINARAETLEEKPSFRDSFKKYRCLIPADGFYEWKENPGRKTKQPYFIMMGSGGLFALAGLCSTWQNRMTGDVTESCAIITTEPNTLLAEIHNRMPVILHPDQYAPWLDSQTGTGMLKQMLKPYDAAGMISHPVSGLCNSPENDSPECIKEMP